MSYADVLLQHFHRPKNQRVLDAAGAVGVAGVPGKGPFLVLYLRLDGEGRVAEAAFQTHGCAPSVAAGSLLATVLPGEVPDDALVGRWTEVAIHEALGGLPDHKRHCSALAAGALERAVAAIRNRTAADQAHAKGAHELLPRASTPHVASSPACEAGPAAPHSTRVMRS